MLKRAWLVISVGWTLFMFWSMNWNAYIAQQILLAAVPWIAGVVLYWIVTGRRPWQRQPGQFPH